MLAEDAERYLERARIANRASRPRGRLTCPSSTATGSRSTTRSMARGPTLLLSHGYSSTARMWDGQIAALKDRYQVIVWDMRGHGEVGLSERCQSSIPKR